MGAHSGSYDRCFPNPLGGTWLRAVPRTGDRHAFGTSTKGWRPSQAFQKPEPWGWGGGEGLPGPESPSAPLHPRAPPQPGPPSGGCSRRCRPPLLSLCLPLPLRSSGDRLGPPASSMDGGLRLCSPPSFGKKRRKVCVALHLGDPSPS